VQALAPRVLLGTLLALALLTIACDPAKQLTFENATNSAVTVRVNDRLRGLIPPGQAKSFSTPNNKGNRRVLAVDEQGNIRLDKNFTWQELEEVAFRLVIR
jgi:hypothetical protein